MVLCFSNEPAADLVIYFYPIHSSGILDWLKGIRNVTKTGWHTACSIADWIISIYPLHHTHGRSWLTFRDDWWAARPGHSLVGVNFRQSDPENQSPSKVDSDLYGNPFVLVNPPPGCSVLSEPFFIKRLIKYPALLKPLTGQIVFRYNDLTR